MAKLSPYGPFRAFDGNGDPLNGGKLYTYDAGTSTPKDTYTDAGGLTPNANPVVLDANGYANVWLGDGGYKFILKTSADATLWTIDDIGGDSANAFASNIYTTSSNTVITEVYQNALIRCSAALTLSLPTAVSAGNGFYFVVKNVAASGNVTIDPNGSELIDGAATFTLYPSDTVLVACNGSVWYTANGIPVAGITTNQISTSGSSGITLKNSGGTTVATFGPTNTTNVTFAGAVNVSGALTAASGTLAVSGTSTAAGVITMAEDTDNGTNKVTITPPQSIASDYTVTLPDAAGTLLLSGTQADMEAQTSGKGMDGANAKYHPAMPKAWGNFTTITTTALRASYRVSSLTDNGTGSTTINLTDAMSSANYAVNVSASQSATAASPGVAPKVDNLSASSFRIITGADGSSASTLTDNDLVMFSVWGDLA